MDFKIFFRKHYMHFVAVAVFLIAGTAYYSLQFGDYGIKQHDIQQYIGMASETTHHIEMTGEEPHWTNSMFGGMPTVQITGYSEGNMMKRITDFYTRNFEIPFGAFFLHALCFYFLAICLRIKPIIGILGALAFSFATYEVVILQAGHITKSMAVGFMPAVVGAFIYTFRRDWRLGAVFSVIFMSFQISANHLQVTYYMGFLLLALGIYFLVVAIKAKELKRFFIATGGLLAAYAISISINYSSVATTSDYAQHTIRGKSDLTMRPDGKKEAPSDGLDIGYITNWSLGKDETMTLFSPYLQGSHSYPVDYTEFSDIPEDLDLIGSNAEYNNFLLYWGDQSSTAGPPYMGIVVVFLALIALVFVKSRMVWVLFGVSVLMVMLSWGKNFMGLTEFFVENIPMYNKFRTVTIILVIVELCLPLMAMLSLQQLYENRDQLKGQKKKFMITSAAFLVFLIGVRVANGGDYRGARDRDTIERYDADIRNQIAQMPEEKAAELGIDKNNPLVVNQVVEKQMEQVYIGHTDMKKIRKEVYNRSANRSILFTIFAIGMCALFFFTSISSMMIVGGLAVLVLIDLIPVDRNYLGTGEDPQGEYLHWMEKEDKAFPIASTSADEQIMEMELLGNEKLKKIVDEGARYGAAKASELELEGDYKSRVVDLYRFRALDAVTNYRVADLRSGWGGAWGSSEASYLHKSIGGYHGAKLSKIQNLFDYQLRYNNASVINMLNIKYSLKGDKAEPNLENLGNAWAVKEVKARATMDDVINSLGTIVKLTNIGEGKIFVNDKQVNNVNVTGRENLKYLLPTGDSLPILISTNIEKDVRVLFVGDKHGQTNLVLPMAVELDTLNSFTSFVELTGVSRFHPENEAIVLSSDAKKLSQKKYTGEAKIKMTSFKPNQIKYDVDAEGKQLIVFSEIYYPNGWKATIDGKEVEILNVNYALRGLEVGSGKHKVEFVYVNEKAVFGKTLARISSVILLLFVAGMGFLWYRSRSKEIKSVQE